MTTEEEKNYRQEECFCIVMPRAVAVLCCLGICVLCCAEKWRSRLRQEGQFFFWGPGASLYLVGEVQGDSSYRVPQRSKYRPIRL